MKATSYRVAHPVGSGVQISDIHSETALLSHESQRVRLGKTNVWNE